MFKKFFTCLFGNRSSAFGGFVIYTRDNHPWKFIPKRSTIPGKRPDIIRENELCYNIADDTIIVGIGNNRYKEYKGTNTHVV